MSERHRSIVDVHLVLRRNGRVLMLRRANTAYADGWLCFPSGHLERGESIPDGVAREAQEEIGITVDVGTLRFMHAVHHRDEAGYDRVGFFFEAGNWEGEPFNAEPGKCSELVWVDPAQPPDDVVPYQVAGLRGSLGPEWFSLHDAACGLPANAAQAADTGPAPTSLSPDQPRDAAMTRPDS